MMGTKGLRKIPGFTAVLLVFCLLFVVFGCSSKNPTSNASASQSVKPSENSPTSGTKVTGPDKLMPIKIGYAQNVLSFAPLHLADVAGLFTKHGLKPTFVLVPGPSSHVVLTTGDIDAQAIGSEIYLGQLARGEKVVAVQTIIGYSQDLNISQKFLDKNKIDVNAPLEERVKKLKGARIGLTSLASPPDVFTRWIVKHYGGLVPEKDVPLPVVGPPAQLQAALEKGEVDGYLLSAPAGMQLEERKLGKVYINHNELKELKSYPFTTITVMKNTIDTNPEMVKRLTAALVEAGQMLVNDKDKAAELLGKSEYYKNLDPQLFKRSLDFMVDTFSVDGKMTQESWDFALNVLKEMEGKIKIPSTVRQGTDWTNEFLPGAK